jgi:hypothetical protein
VLCFGRLARLLSLALRSYLTQRRRKEITERLNHVYSKRDLEEARLVLRMKAKFRRATGGSW